MKVTIIPIVIGAFGTVTKGLLKGLEDLEVGGRGETIQTTTLLRTVPKAPITIGTIVTFLFYSFLFNSLAMSRYLFFFLHSFSFILWSAVTAQSSILQILFFVDYYKVWFSEIRWSICMSKFHRSLCVSFPWTGAGLCIIIIIIIVVVVVDYVKSDQSIISVL